MSTAARDPGAVGLKVTVIVQALLPPSAEPQLLVWLKSPGSAPLKLKLVMPMEAVLPLVTVACIVADVPELTIPKVNTVGEIVSALIPVPVRGTVCGLPVALSLTLMLAVRAPRAVGTKVMLMVQLASFASDVPQVVDLLKSAVSLPVKVIDEMSNVAVPVLDIVVVIVALGLW